jgi:hypothetical protein
VRACRCGSVARRASSKHRSEPPAEAA